MPTLPEFCNVLAQERMPEVFFQLKAHHTGNSDCHIGITGEVEVNLHGIDNDTIPSP